MRRSEELEALVEGWFAAASRGDATLVEAHVSDAAGVRLVGSDPDEWIGGGKAVRTFLLGEVTGAGGDVTFTPADTEAYEEGSVGWAATRLTLSMPDGRHVSPRWTAVFVREGNTWRFVQTHASIGVTNDAVGWTYD